MKKTLLFISFLLIISITYSQTIEYRYIDTNAGLWLRENPSKDAKKIELMPDGERVKILQENTEELILDNKKGKWIQVERNNKIGWAFSGFMSIYNQNRWITSKSGLPYYTDTSHAPALIPYKEKVKLIGPAKEKNYVAVVWNNKKVYVRNEFLNESSEIKYNYTDLRQIASKKLAYNPKVILYPEDLYIKQYNWLYHIVYIYRDQEDYKTYVESLWIKDGNQWKRIKLPSDDTNWYQIQILEINDDTNPDVIISGGCCSTYEIEVYLGQSNQQLKKIFSKSGAISEDKNNDESPTLKSVGKCNNTVIEYKKKRFKYNCTDNQFD